MDLPYLLDKEGSLGRIKELKRYMAMAKMCFDFMFSKLLVVWDDEKHKRTTAIGHGKMCLLYLDEMLGIENDFISNQDFPNFHLGCGTHGFPSLGSWEADIKFTSEQKEWHDYWLASKIKSLDDYKDIPIREKADCLCFFSNELNLTVRFYFSEQRLVMTDKSNFCLIVLPQTTLKQYSDHYFENDDQLRDHWRSCYCGGRYYDAGYHNNGKLDYWKMLGRPKSLWSRGSGKDKTECEDLVWFFMSGKLNFSDILTLSPKDMQEYHCLVMKIVLRKRFETIGSILRSASSGKIKHLVNEIEF